MIDEKCVKCSCRDCDKPAIGYEAGGDRGMSYCEEHASQELLSMKPGDEYDEKNGRLCWEFLSETGKLVPNYRYKFLIPGQQDKSNKTNSKPDGCWTTDACADVLMVHRSDIPNLIRKGYMKSKEVDGEVYITYQSIHHYIDMLCKWGILLPFVWRFVR
jgi:hypothetical protein